MEKFKSIFKSDSIFLTVLLVVSIIGLIFIFTMDSKKGGNNSGNDNTPTNPKDFIMETREFYLLDTFIQIKLYGTDKKDINKKLDDIEKIYNDYHHLTSKYDKYDDLNNLYYINNHPNQDITVDKRLYDLIDFSLSYYEKSNHLMNIAFGSVLDVWHNYREKCENGGACELPTMAELEEANTHIDPSKIELNKENLTIKIPQGYNLDLGATAKGYITEVAADYLVDNGYEYFLINAGGNVRVGKHPEGRPFNIGLEDPLNSGELGQTNTYGIVKMENMSAVTSGDYQRYFEVNGKKYHHIISPNTLYPADFGHAVTVITEDSGIADALSTTVFLMSPEDAIKFVDSLDGVECIYYDFNGKLHFSKGFKEKFLKELSIDE